MGGFVEPMPICILSRDKKKCGVYCTRIFPRHQVLLAHKAGFLTLLPILEKIQREWMGEGGKRWHRREENGRGEGGA
jgi:hypothetical protein